MSTKILKKSILECVLFALVSLAPFSGARAEEEAKKSLDKSLDGLKFGIVGYLDYSSGTSPLPGGEELNYNQFALTRGYLTVENTFTPRMGARLTMDLSLDKSDSIKVADGATITEYKVANDLEGSYVVRFKYYYAWFKPEDLGPFTNMKVELGMGHMPWLDFEEHINPYRCQGTMAIERAGVLNSADLGVSIMGYFGGELEDAKGKTGNKNYAGRLGSWHLGVYNGSGYHAAEKNQDKVFEGRVTLRPLPDFAPGLQLSYFYLTGMGNTSTEFNNDTYWPYYRAQIGMVSFEHPAFTATGQYFATDGNAKGGWVYGAKGQALPTAGQSYFVNVKVPGTDNKLSVLGRYDYFDIDPEDKIVEDGESAYVMTMYGLAYDAHQGNLLMIAYETTDYDDDADVKGKLPKAGNELGDEEKIQVVYQIKL